MSKRDDIEWFQHWSFAIILGGFMGIGCQLYFITNSYNLSPKYDYFRLLHKSIKQNQLNPNFLKFYDSIS